MEVEWGGGGVKTQRHGRDSNELEIEKARRKVELEYFSTFLASLRWGGGEEEEEGERCRSSRHP